MMGAMAAAKKIGRPSKGDRQVVWSRIATPRVRDLQELAAARGLPVSDVVDALVAVGLDHVTEAKLPAPQEVLPQSA
jgi:hypothetical protein